MFKVPEITELDPVPFCSPVTFGLFVKVQVYVVPDGIELPIVLGVNVKGVPLQTVMEASLIATLGYTGTVT